MSVLLRVGLFALIEIIGLAIFPGILLFAGGYLIAAALGTFAAAATANAIAVRVWENGRLSSIGLNWTPHSKRNFALGLAGGAVAALLVVWPPVMLGLAELRPQPGAGFDWASLLFVLAVLLFGAVGEEMLFRGYGFQVLLARFGAFAAILPVSALFALAHTNNTNASTVGLVNTFAWGVVLGYAFVRSHDLWLPIGLHYGWNAVLPLFGVNLSGFKMGVTGYAITWHVGPLWSGGDYGPEASILTSLVIVPLCLYLWKAPVGRS